MAASSVDFPEPLAPMRPSVSDSWRSRVTPRTASMVVNCLRTRPCEKFCFKPALGSSYTR